MTYFEQAVRFLEDGKTEDAAKYFGYARDYGSEEEKARAEKILAQLKSSGKADVSKLFFSKTGTTPKPDGVPATLSETDESRVNAAFNNGCKNISQKDFDEVLDREEEFNEKGFKLGDMWDSAKSLFQMLKDYKDGRYTDIPWTFIAATVFAVVFGLVLKTFSDNIADYKKWRESGDRRIPRSRKSF